MALQKKKKKYSKDHYWDIGRNYFHIVMAVFRHARDVRGIKTKT